MRNKYILVGLIATLPVMFQNCGNFSSHSMPQSETISYSKQTEGGVMCGDDCISIDEIPLENSDDKFEQAIELASTSSEIKKIFVPNGTYELKKTIKIKHPRVNFAIVGESSTGVILNFSPNNCWKQAIQITRINSNFKSLSLAIKNLTIDMTKYQETADYASGECPGRHGIAVGSGWAEGSGLEIEGIQILNPTGYGIGIQNNKSYSISANNVKIKAVSVINAGADGLDTKQPPSGDNKGLTIEDFVVWQAGFYQTGTKAAMDISYDDFLIDGVIIVTDAIRDVPGEGSSQVAGLRIRDRMDGGGNNGVVKNLLVSGATRSIVIEGANSPPENLSFENLTLSGYKHAAIRIVGGSHLSFKNGCIFNGDPDSVFFDIDRENTRDLNVENIGRKEKDCPKNSDGN